MFGTAVLKKKMGLLSRGKNSTIHRTHPFIEKTKYFNVCANIQGYASHYPPLQKHWLKIVLHSLSPIKIGSSGLENKR